MPTPQRVSATEVGEYIRYGSCARRFKLALNDRDLGTSVPFSERLFNQLDPVLMMEGKKREETWAKSLADAGLAELGSGAGNGTVSWDELVRGIAALPPGMEAFAREVEVEGRVGAFSIRGRVDFVIIRWIEGRLVLRLAECKASRRDRTYQRIQVALYRVLVRQLLRTGPEIVADGYPARISSIECVVVRIDESTNESQDILRSGPLDLSQEEADIQRLLAADGALQQIVECELDSLDFQLEPKCDTCVFSVHCLTESARQRRLQLLGLEANVIRALGEAGIQTIDQLADLDLGSAQASMVRALPTFTENLQVLREQARTRRRTLPGGDADPDSYEVSSLPFVRNSQLPEYDMDGHRLIRVYLTVHFDYVENRIGALAAHVTKGAGQAHTGFVQTDAGWRPDPRVYERRQTGTDESGRPVYQLDPLTGQDVVEYKTARWTGRYPEDTGAERELIQRFLRRLTNAIAEVAGTEHAPVHFYVWSRSEITRLVEACSRVGSGPLSHLRELLGCRESLEQLIYSCVQDEVDQRYALAWTGRGLVVAASLTWFGRRFHWNRIINGESVALDVAFEQDIFDFKSTLDLRADGDWADARDVVALRHRFEIRSRFYDALTAPYWFAQWDELPSRADVSDSRTATAIARYERSAAPNYFEEYLKARAHALRWIEESIRFKNREIRKPLLAIRDLRRFTLGVDSTARAAVDFLRLDHHVKVTDWIAAHLTPPIARVSRGRTIPLRDVRSLGGDRMVARIDLDGFDVTYEALEANCSLGDWVRVTPAFEDPNVGQTVGQLLQGGITCVVRRIDWAAREVLLEVRPLMNGDHYRLRSAPRPAGPVFPAATLDASPSDYVAVRVERRLFAAGDHPMYRWLDPERPQMPDQVQLDSALRTRFETLVQSLELPNGRRLSGDQVAAILDGLNTRTQLLQGPPGTGKTTTTAVIVLLRILARRRVGDLVLLAAHTHTAVNHLLRWIDALYPAFSARAQALGFHMPNVRVAKANSSPFNPVPGGGVLAIPTRPCKRVIKAERSGAVLIIGSTTSGLLTVSEELNSAPEYRNEPRQFQVPMLVVDEASMMVFPHFLALATLVESDGEIMLAGDHRQLAPIVAHDWEREDRPPVILYQPYVSAYDAIRGIKGQAALADAAVLHSQLNMTFRLPPAIVDLISAVYRPDGIELRGLPMVVANNDDETPENAWEHVWRDGLGLHLVVHSERRSFQSNTTEGEIIEAIIRAGGVLPENSIAVVTPHRAQRALLSTRLEPYMQDGGAVDLVDTVEKLQGDERPTIIVSATESDPAAITKRVEFILDLNRSNVAFSRTQRRLMVICSSSLLDHIPAEIEHYHSAMLWKALREFCTELVATIAIGGHVAKIYRPSRVRLMESMNVVGQAPAEHLPHE